MRLWSQCGCLLVATMLLAGCATALKRDGRCLASLTPEFLAAQEELQGLQETWRALLRREVISPPKAPQQGATTSSQLQTEGSDARQRVEASAAYARLVEARRRHQPTLDWYDKVYRRVVMRIEEEQLLSEVRTVLIPTPGLLFYPVIHWNIHSVMWDGENPDAETDPVTRFCTDRLAEGPRTVASE